MKISSKKFNNLSIGEKLLFLNNNNILNDQQVSELSNPISFHSLSKVSENVVGRFTLPFSIAPNIIIDNAPYNIPLVTEESSVVAAICKASKFWNTHGGIRTKVHNSLKTGSIYFTSNTPLDELRNLIDKFCCDVDVPLKQKIHKMISRGGHAKYTGLGNVTSGPVIYKLNYEFDTQDCMGANFINTTLEFLSSELLEFSGSQNIGIDILMSIVSNNNPSALVSATASCPITALGALDDTYDSSRLAQRLCSAVKLSLFDKDRAVTHNKGIMNGIDAFLTACGNDTRASNASVHAYASTGGNYKGLSGYSINESDELTINLKLPLTPGVIGGITKYHKTASLAIDILNNPSAKKMMGIGASVGLLSNFSALLSLVTEGIQKGHMALHHAKANNIEPILT